MHCNRLKLLLKGPSQPHLCFSSHTRVGYYTKFYSEHVEAKQITLKLLNIKEHTFRNTTYSEAIRFLRHAISIISIASKMAEAD